MLNGTDLELLSAYLDDALNPQERAGLEARLQTDAELRRELERLRATVDLLKTLPTLSAPRNFTLTPRMARRPGILTSAVFSAMSAAAAVILLVIGAALFSIRPAAQTNARDQIAFAPTDTAPFAQTARQASGGAAPPASANIVQPTQAKSESQEAQAASGALRVEPTETPPPTTVLLFSASLPTGTPLISDALQNNAPSQEGAADQAQLLSQQAAPAPAVNGAAAAEAPLPAPTLLPTATPSDTPTNTPSPTFTPSATPTDTPTRTPTLTPTPIPPAPSTQDVNTVGVGLIAAALLLFGLALVTTLLRRRS